MQQGCLCLRWKLRLSSWQERSPVQNIHVSEDRLGDVGMPLLEGLLATPASIQTQLR